MKPIFPVRFFCFICFFACLLLSVTSRGQANTHSFAYNLQRTDNDSQTLKVYEKIISIYQYSKPDSAVLYIKQGLAQFTNSNYKPGIAYMLTYLGMICSDQNMPGLAQKTIEKALKIYVELKDKNGIATSYNLIGVALSRSGNYTEATDHFFKSLKIFEALNDTSGITNTYIKIGGNFDRSGNFEKALEFYNKGLDLLKDTSANDLVICLNSNIESILKDKKGNFVSMNYLKKKLEESKDSSYIQIRPLHAANMGVVFALEGDTLKALSYARHTLNSVGKDHNPSLYESFPLNKNEINPNADHQHISRLIRSIDIAGVSNFRNKVQKTYLPYPGKAGIEPINIAVEPTLNNIPENVPQFSIENLSIESPIAYNDSEYLKVYDSIFLHFEYANSDSQIYYMRQGLALFTTHNYKPGIAGMLANLGGVYSTQGMMEAAEKATSEALKIFTELNNKKGIANTNNILGVIEGRKSNYPDATNHFLTALKIFEDVSDTSAISDTYIKLGTADDMAKNFDKALEYYNTGLSLQKDKPVNDVTIFLDNNIGSVYFEKNDYQEAMKYLQKALVESNSPAYAQIHILPLQNMSEVYSKMGDTAMAIFYLQQALDIAVKEHLPADYANILLNIAGLTLRTDPEKALALLNDALQTTKKTGERSLQVEVLKTIIPIYKKQGKYSEAYALLEQEKKLSDSILNIDKEKALANLEALYDVDKLNAKVQQLELSEQQQQQKKNSIITIAVLLTIILSVAVSFLWKTKLLNTELSKRELSLKKSSDVKNKLISIIAHDLIGSIGFMPLSLGLTKDKSIPAEDKDALLTQLELNATASFETLQNMLDWGKAQIQGITLNQSDINVNEISSEVLQFINIAANNKGVTVNNHIAPDMTVYADPNHFKFIFRNLLSNAVKYSYSGGVIAINAKESDDASQIIFSVKDNGAGITGDKISRIFESSGSSVAGTGNEKGNGIGLNLCKEFVLENGGAIWVESEKDKGSIFYFSLKANIG